MHFQIHLISFDQYQDAILKYNTRYAKKWDFSALFAYFNREMTSEESNAFFGTTLPDMVRLALRLPELCTKVNYTAPKSNPVFFQVEAEDLFL